MLLQQFGGGWEVIVRFCQDDIESSSLVGERAYRLPVAEVTLPSSTGGGGGATTIAQRTASPRNTTEEASDDDGCCRTSPRWSSSHVWTGCDRIVQLDSAESHVTPLV